MLLRCSAIRRASSLTSRSRWRDRKRASTSERPCHFSGSGASPLASSCASRTSTVSSSLCVRHTGPSTRTKSPTSSRFTNSNTSGGTSVLRALICRRSPFSSNVANTSLPNDRSAITRPATAARCGSAASAGASRSPNRSRTDASDSRGPTRAGYGSTPASRSAASFARRTSRSLTPNLPVSWSSLAFGSLRETCGASRAPEQRCANEAVEVALEHSLHVAELGVGAVVLHALLRVERVGADLAAEPDLPLLPAQRRHLLFVLLPRVVVEPRAQHLHRRGAVLVLRPLVLALHDDAGGQVREADRRVGLVDVLAARSARAIGVDAQVVLVDVDLDRIVDLG